MIPSAQYEVATTRLITSVWIFGFPFMGLTVIDQCEYPFILMT